MNTPSALSSFADRAYGVLKPPRYDEPQLNAWAQKVDIPLALVAIVFLGAYAAPIIDPALPRAIIRVCVWTTNIVWLIFAADYLIRLLLVKHRWSFIRYHLFDLAIVGLPFFQPLRLLRLVFLLRILNRHAGHSLRGQISSYVMGAAAIITLVGALAALDVERYAADSQITTFPEALWWAFVTITTVGYGDFAPVTHQGRLVATGMMIFGVALLGTVTATLASWLVESVKTDEEEVDCSPELQAIYSLTNQVEQLEKEIVSLKAQLNQLPSD